MKIDLEQADGQLRKLVADASGGEEVILTDRDQPVARLVPETANLKDRRAALESFLELAGTVRSEAQDVSTDKYRHLADLGS